MKGIAWFNFYLDVERFKCCYFLFINREVVNEFEMKQLKDRVSVAMSACDCANKLKVGIELDLFSPGNNCPLKHR